MASEKIILSEGWFHILVSSSDSLPAFALVSAASFSDARIYLPPLPDLWRLRRAQTPALFGRTQPGACELSGVYEVSVLKPAEDKRKESIALFTVTLTTWPARTSSSLLR